MDEGGILKGIKDPLHTVFNGKDKTGGQLAQSSPCIHQGRGVGQKQKIGHHPVKAFTHLFYLGLITIPFLCLGNMV